MTDVYNEVVTTKLPYLLKVNIYEVNLFDVVIISYTTIIVVGLILFGPRGSFTNDVDIKLLPYSLVNNLK